MPAFTVKRTQILDALARESYDLVAYFGHGDRRGWLGYLGGFGVDDFVGASRQRLMLSCACEGLASDAPGGAFGQALVERGVCDCFVGSFSCTDSIAGRRYMMEFALAMADCVSTIGELHRKACERTGLTCLGVCGRSDITLR